MWYDLTGTIFKGQSERQSGRNREAGGQSSGGRGPGVRWELLSAELHTGSDDGGKEAGEEPGGDCHQRGRELSLISK